MDRFDSEPLVSVLMTAFNREKYIEQSILSVINSTYQNWELVIVDDQSSDNTYNIAKSYGDIDKRIRVYKNDCNLGDYPNRNMAASYAKGKYIKYLDADDLLYKYSLSYFVDALEAHPSAGLALSFIIIDDVYPYPQVLTPREIIFEEYLGKSILGYGPSAAMIKKSVFDELKGFSGRQYVGDHELWLKIASKYPVVKMQPSLIWYRVHPDQQINQERKDYKIKNIRFQLNVQSLKDNSLFLSEDEFKYALKRLNQNYSRGLLRTLLINKKLGEFLRLYQLSGLSFMQLISGFGGYKQ